jgi:hypothetical protein
MVGYFSPDLEGRRKFAGSGRAATSAALVACLLLLAASVLSADPVKAKEGTTKPSSVAALKTEVPAVSAPAANAAVDPATCAKPEDAGASPVGASDEKPSVAAQTSASDAETSDSSSESKADFMKDKLKLSLGGKSGSGSDQPQQCGIDEAKEK